MLCHLTSSSEDAHAEVSSTFICFFLLERFSKLSRHERPLGSLLPFGPGDVATRIRPITGRRSLFPLSSARTLDSVPYGSPAGETGEDTGLPRSTSLTE